MRKGMAICHVCDRYHHWCASDSAKDLVPLLAFVARDALPEAEVSI